MLVTQIFKGCLELLPFEICDIDVDNGGVGTNHLVYEVLIEFLTLPIFYVD